MLENADCMGKGIEVRQRESGQSGDNAVKAGYECLETKVESMYGTVISDLSSSGRVV